MNDNASITLRFPTVEFEQLAKGRTSTKRTFPELVTPDKLRAPKAYKRFRDMENKAAFKQKLLATLKHAWQTKLGEGESARLESGFLNLASQLDSCGAVIFGDLVARSEFARFVAQYDGIMKDAGSRSFIHSYVDFRNYPQLFKDATLNAPFLHPLLIALISHAVGGPVRIVDARGKDAEPISILAQDNMLHIDNTPFNDEYKVLVTWERGRASGPKGQNFVFLPGTQKGARNCFVGNDGKAWSTENGSIFVTEDSIDALFEFQKMIRHSESPLVVEAQDPERPLTTVFAAGSLVHHRFRTETGSSRSCIIIAFHRAADNRGTFCHSERATDGTRLPEMLIGSASQLVEASFLNALAEVADNIGHKISEVEYGNGSTVVLQQEEKALSAAQIQAWKQKVVYAPRVETIKTQRIKLPLGNSVTGDQFIQAISEMMAYDKHGPLDLILYEDSHEEIRKWARNRTREMKRTLLNAKLVDWKSEFHQPVFPDLLETTQIVRLAEEVVRVSSMSFGNPAEWPKNEIVEAISPVDAYRSLRQLVCDLAEAITRCESFQAFVSTSLFLFWSADGIWRFTPCDQLRSICGVLLRNYVAAALVERHIVSTDGANSPAS